jgi:hypothetical protein
MENRTIAQRLALADSRVQRGEVQLNRQRALVRHLERHGLGTFQARRLLKDLEDAQTGFIADRDQLKCEMAMSAANLPGVHAGDEVPGSPAG